MATVTDSTNEASKPGRTLATRLPTLASLLAFESAARHSSFSRAAVELHLTQSAISHQISQLERQLGFTLFERVRQRVILTSAGRNYLGDVVRSLSGLMEGTSRARASGGKQVLNLAVLPSFSIKWLMPRIMDFFEKNPGIIVNFLSRKTIFDFEDERIHAAIHYGEAIWPDACATRLMEEGAVPLASPAYIQSLGIETPEDFDKASLLQQFTRPSAWQDWFSSLGLELERAYVGTRFDSFALAAEAAKEGMGIALLPRFLFESDIRRGDLCVVWDHVLPSERAYYFVCPEKNKNIEIVALFGDWITNATKGAATTPRDDS